MSVGDILERDEDRPAYVRFERRAIKDNEASLKAGHYVSKDEDYALITPPYSKDCVVKKADKWFENVEKQVINGRIKNCGRKHIPDGRMVRSHLLMGLLLKTGMPFLRRSVRT